METIQSKSQVPENHTPARECHTKTMVQGAVQQEEEQKTALWRRIPPHQEYTLHVRASPGKTSNRPCGRKGFGIKKSQLRDEYSLILPARHHFIGEPHTEV